MSELLNPQTFEVTLPSHLGMPEAERPVFVFRTRTWRKTIELDEITAKFLAVKKHGDIPKLLGPPIREHLVAEKSPDIERLSCPELLELFICMRECESIELAAKKKSLLQSLSGVEKSVESAVETAESPNSSNSIVPAATEKDAPAAAGEESSS